MNRISLLNFDVNTKTSILIGENGGGKSEYLNKIAEKYISNNYNVIAISNCIFDKYTIKARNFNFLGAKDGINMLSSAISIALLKLYKDNNNFFIIDSILTEVGYSAEIGLSINVSPHIHEKDIPNIIYKERKSNIDIKTTLSSLSLLNNNLLKKNNKNHITWISTKLRNISDLININVLYLINDLSSIRSDDISLNFFLKKGNTEIPIEKASSGEIQRILTLIFIAAHIDKRTAILIDEPENSLHPKWQREFIKTISKFFYMHDPRLIMATHSPLIVSLKKTDHENKIYKIQEFKMTNIEANEKNIEYILWNIFGIITPESNYFSNLLIDTLNDLKNKNTTIVEVRNLIRQIKLSIYDERQERILDDFLDLAERI